MASLGAPDGVFPQLPPRGSPLFDHPAAHMWLRGTYEARQRPASDFEFPCEEANPTETAFRQAPNRVLPLSWLVLRP